MRKPFQSKLNNLKIFLCLPAARVESLQINLFNFGAYIRYLKFVNNNNNKNEKPKLNYTTIFQRQTGIASLVGMTKIYDLKLIPSRTNTTEITNHTRVDYIVMNQGAVEMLMGLITFSDVTKCCLGTTCSTTSILFCTENLFSNPDFTPIFNAFEAEPQRENSHLLGKRKELSPNG